MKKQLYLPLTALAGGSIALALRLVQNATGFEAETGLPVPGNPAAAGLFLLLAVLAAALLAEVFRLPKGGNFAFPADFSTNSPALLTLLVAGVFLIAASGVLDILAGLGIGGSLGVIGGPDGPTVVFSTAVAGGGRKAALLSPQTHLLMGALSLLSAGGLFPAVAACRRRETASPFSIVPLLFPPVCMVIRLVLDYRIESVNPVLESYYTGLLTLVFLTLAFYRLAGFACGAGRPRIFGFYAAFGVALCLTALADSRGVSTLLLYLGGALTLLGFLLLLPAKGAAAQTEEKPEES